VLIGARNYLRERNLSLRLVSVIVPKQSAVIRVLMFLSVFGCMFLFSGFSSAVPGVVGNVLLVVVGVLFLVLAVFLARKYWSVIKPSI
jgi:membrane-bound ClpP family serine protease